MRTCTQRRGRWMSLGLVLVVMTTFSSAWAGPPESEFGELKQQLNKTINVNFLETPVLVVLNEVCQQAGMNLVLPQPSTVEGAGNVTLRMQGATVHRILNIVTESKGLDWQVRDGVLIVASSTSIRRQRVTTEVYDIATLVQIRPSFAAKPLALGVGTWLDDEMRDSGAALFDTDDSNVRAQASQQILGDIMELIRDSVGNPLEWADRGGDISAIREMRGHLIVRTTPEGHKEIKKLLDMLRGQIGRMVAVEMIVANVSSEQIERVMEANKRSPVLDPQLTARLWNSIVSEQEDRVAIARNVCFNGQRVYLGGTRSRTYVQDMEPVPDAEGADPDIDLAREGLSIDVQPTIGSTGKAVTVILRGDVAKTTEMQTNEQVTFTGRSTPTIELDGSTDGSIDGTARKPSASGQQNIDGGLDANTDLTGTIQPAEGSTLSIRQIDLPEQEITQYRTAVDIVDGGGVLLTTASEATVKDADAEQVMLLRIRIIPMQGQE